MSEETTTLWLPNDQMRERATVPSVDVSALLAAVKGYMIPIYIDVLPNGKRVGALGKTDIQRVADGYACGECLAMFDKRFENCPGCSHELDPNRDIVDWSPAYWQPYEGRTSEEILSAS